MARELVGRWRIEAMELWDRGAIDLVGPGFIDIGSDGIGELSFIAVVGCIDCSLRVLGEAVDCVRDGAIGPQRVRDRAAHGLTRTG